MVFFELEMLQPWHWSRVQPQADPGEVGVAAAFGDSATGRKIAISEMSNDIF